MDGTAVKIRTATITYCWPKDRAEVTISEVESELKSTRWLAKR